MPAWLHAERQRRAERALRLGKLGQGGDFAENIERLGRFGHPPQYMELIKRVPLHIPGSARTGEQRVSSVRALCRALSMEAFGSRMGAAATAAVCPIFLQSSLLLVCPLRQRPPCLGFITVINNVVPAQSRTNRNIVSATCVLCAGGMPLFIKQYGSDRCFQQGPRRLSGRSIQDQHI